MSRVLASSGQFAHVSVKQIDQCLSALYRRHKFAPYPDEENADEMGVSDELIRLYRSEMIPMLFRASGTIGALAQRQGYLCAACFSAQKESMHGGRKLAFLMCPTYLTVQHGLRNTSKDELEHRYDRTDFNEGPLCQQCWYSFFRIFGPGRWWFDDQIMMMAALSQLLSLASFQRRVKSNAHRKLRFDPRWIDPTNPSFLMKSKKAA